MWQLAKDYLMNWTDRLTCLALFVVQQTIKAVVALDLAARCPACLVLCAATATVMILLVQVVVILDQWVTGATGFTKRTGGCGTGTAGTSVKEDVQG